MRPATRAERDAIGSQKSLSSYRYDRNGNKLTLKDANKHVWSYNYDVLNRLIQETDPLNRTMSLTYDPLGNLKTKTEMTPAYAS